MGKTTGKAGEWKEKGRARSGKKARAGEFGHQLEGTKTQGKKGKPDSKTGLLATKCDGARGG